MCENAQHCLYGRTISATANEKYGHDQSKKIL